MNIRMSEYVEKHNGKLFQTWGANFHYIYNGVNDIDKKHNYVYPITPHHTNERRPGYVKDWLIELIEGDLDYDQTIRYIHSNFKTFTPHSNKASLKVQLPKGMGFAKFVESILHAKNVEIEPAWNKNKDKNGFIEIFVMDNLDYPLKAQVLEMGHWGYSNDEKRKSQYSHFVKQACAEFHSNDTTAATWFIQSPSRPNVWVKFIEGSLNGRIANPYIPVGSFKDEYEPGDIVEVMVRVSNGTVYGNTQLKN
jgi:hypothetical protein